MSYAFGHRDPHGTQKPRTAILCAFISYCIIQASWLALVDGPVPEFRDPEFAYKMAELRRLRQEQTGKPLCLVLGSSRAGVGICPAALRDEDIHHHEPLVFNLALTGAGPITELIALRRALAAGIHPDYALIEIMPALLGENGTWGEARWIDTSRLTFKDFMIWRKYTGSRREVTQSWVLNRLAPIYSQRYAIMSGLAPGWLPWTCRQDGYRAVDHFGWIRFGRESASDVERQEALHAAQNQYSSGLAHFSLNPKTLKALHELLSLCQSQHIRCGLLLMPEGFEFQSMYPANARRAIDGYLSDLTREFQIPLFDTRDWMPETAFADSHHLLPKEAAVFTHKLEHEALTPLFANDARAALSN
jgi:hypothetical protein